MSYYFKISFKEIEEKELLDYCVNFLKYELGHAKDIIKRNYDYIPSVKNNLLSDNIEKIFAPWKVADSTWLDRLFTRRFIYWSDKNLLGIEGEVDKTFDKTIRTITFQNRVDNDYEYREWEGIKYFQKVIDKFKEADENIILSYFKYLNLDKFYLHENLEY